MTITWTERTLPPERDFQWQQIRCSDDGSVILALVYYDLSYLSTDGGVTWSICDPNPSVTAGVWNPAVAFYWWDCDVSGDGNTIIMVANQDFGYIENDPDSDVPVVQGYISKDKGVTWSEVIVNDALPGQKLYFCCSDYDGSHLIVGTYDDGYVYLSTDGGTNWTQLMNGVTPIIAYAGAISVDGSHIYVCGNDDLYGSTDGGANWTLLYNDATRLVEYVECNADGSIIVIDTYGGRIFRSIDSGANWTEPRPNGDSNEYWYWGMSRDAQVLICRCDSTTTYISTNGGTTWGSLGLSKGLDCFGLDYDGSVRIVADGGERIYRYVDSAWTEIYPHQGLHFESWFGWVYRGGSFDSVGSKQVICSTHNFGQIYISADYGATWTALDPWGDGDRHDWQCVRISTDGNVIVAGTGGGASGSLFASSDGGVNWTEATVAGKLTGEWTDVAVNSDGSVIYAMSKYSSNYGIFKSTNYGVTFSDVTPTPKPNYSYYRYVACDASGDIVLVNMNTKLYYSANGGSTWSILTAPGTRFLNDRVHVSADGTILGLQTNYKLYISSDSGVTWTELDYTTGLDAPPEDDTWYEWGVRFSRDFSCIAVALSTLFPYYHSAFVLSFDYGATWTALQDPPILGRGKGWENFTLSDDGIRLTACEYSGSVWTGVYTEDTDEWPNEGLYEAVVIHGDPIEPSTNALKSQTVVRTTWELPFPWQYIECPPDGVVEYRRIRVQTTTPFWTSEKSLSNSQPIELHMFATPTTVWRYADSPININYTGGGIVTFRGSVLAVSFDQSSRDGNREAIITIDPYMNDFGSNGLTWRYDRNCSTSLYTDACGILRASYEVTGTLTSITNQVELAATEFSTKADGWFVGGDILIGDFRRKIMYHVGDTIRISRRIPDLAVGNTFTAWAGCDRTLDTCIAKFDNKNNFRGSPFIPEVNPTGVNGIV